MTKTKTCQNCKIKFTIEPEDFKFYEKIDVPEPTFCHECQLIRQLASWNERVLYRRKCDLCNKSIVSIYSSDKPFKVYCNECWWSDKWDPLDYGRDYNLSRSFFEQFNELQKKIPIINLLNKKSINSEYCHDALEMKNCYMIFLAGMCQDCSYGTYVIGDKDCIDSYKVVDSELCYDSIDCSKCYRLFFCEDCNNCHSSAFLFDCRNCSDCLGCVGLRSKQYYIFNKPYSKKDYKEEIKKYNLGSQADLAEIRKKFSQFNLKFPRKFARIYKSVNVVGDEIYNSKNCFHCFKVDREAEDCRYVTVAGWNIKDSQDIFNAGLNVSLSYDSVNVITSSKVIFSTSVWSSREIEYSDYCHNSSNLFGCVSLHNKKHCILNKQYSELEYKEIVVKIKKQMDRTPYTDKKGRIYKYGEYFPMELSRFGYNESVAQLYFPLKKEQALKQGYSWYDKPKTEYKPTIKAKDLPDNIKDVDNSILKQVIECKDVNSCAGSGVFRIIPQELKFYKKMNLSLPRLCPECRHAEKVKQRNLLKLWKRQCMNKGCSNKFQTTYAPDRKEIVYCEKCYLKEVG